MQRDDPRFPQNGEVLDQLVIDLLKAEVLVAIGEIVERDAVVPAAA